MKLLIDMNLSPDWVDELQSYGWYAVSLVSSWSSCRDGSHDHGLGAVSMIT